MYLISTGVGLIIFGIIFLVWPDLLVYLVSFFFILLGLMSIGLAWRIRQMEKKVRSTIHGFTDNVKDTIHGISDSFDQF